MLQYCNAVLNSIKIVIDSRMQGINRYYQFTFFLMDGRYQCYAATIGTMNKTAFLQESFVTRVSRTAKPLWFSTRRRTGKYLLPRPMSSNNQEISIDDEIYRVLEEELGFGGIKNKSFLGGSSWSSCLRIETADGHQVFAKVAIGKPSSCMFQGEALGLKAMYGAWLIVFICTISLAILILTQIPTQ